MKLPIEKGAGPSSPNIAAINAASPVTSTTTKGDQLKRQKLQRVFEGDAAARRKTGNANATVDYIKLRLRLKEENLPKTSVSEKIKRKLHIGEQRTTRSSLVDETQKKYIEGVLGRDPKLTEERKAWRTPALVEWMHTGLGRGLGLLGAVGAHQLHGNAGGAMLHQGLGYGPQAPITGLGRIASEIWQILLNDGGKPKLPPSVQNAPGLKAVRKGLKEVTAELKNDNATLRAAIAAATALDAPRGDIEALRQLLADFGHGHDRIAGPDGQYIARWAAFKRQYMGKRWGGAVSMLAGSVATPLNATVPLAGKLAHVATLLLQVPAGYADFMKDKDYTLRTAAKKIDLTVLLKEDRRDKPLDKIEPDDIDVTTASKFYEEKPQAVIAVTREIYRHKLAELMFARRKLTKEIDAEKFTIRFVPDALTPSGAVSDKCKQEQLAQKTRKRATLDEKIAALKKEIGHFERGETDEIDLQGRIGKAMTDPWYFFRKGTSARVHNKVGEFWAQAFQRLGNNFQMLSSVGEIGIIVEILGEVYGQEFVNEGLAALAGQAHHEVSAEAAAIGVMAAEVVAGINAGTTVIAARDHKDAVDRKKLAVPEWIRKGLVPGQLQDQLEDALKKGALSHKKKEKIAQADGGDGATPPDPKRKKKMEKVLDDWTDLKERVQKMREDWIINDILDKDGRLIVVDLTDSAACYRENVPLLRRTLRVAKAIPAGLFSAPMLAWEGLKTRRSRSDAMEQVAEFEQLAGYAKEVMQRHAPMENLKLPEVDDAVFETRPERAEQEAARIANQLTAFHPDELADLDENRKRSAREALQDLQNQIGRLMLDTKITIYLKPRTVDDFNKAQEDLATIAATVAERLALVAPDPGAPSTHAGGKASRPAGRRLYGPDENGDVIDMAE